MLRHSSPRQVRKYRREQNLQKRFQQWADIITRYGDDGITYACKHGVKATRHAETGIVNIPMDHLPGVPLDFPNGLEVSSGTTTGRNTSSTPQFKELPK